VDTQSYVPLIAKHFLAGRGFRDESANPPEFCDLAQLGGVDADNVTFEKLMPLMEGTLERGEWLILVVHEVDANCHRAIWPEVLVKWCEFASNPDNGVWIDTVATVAHYVHDQRASGRC